MQNLFDAAQVARASNRIALGTDTRPPQYLKIERVQLPATHRIGADGVVTYQGPTLAENHFRYEIGGDCIAPVYREMYGRPFKDRVSFGPRKPVWLEIFARCRKCEKCLAKRATLWRGRLLGELRHTQASDKRAWFCTLTAGPSMRWSYKLRAMRKYNAGGKQPEAKGSNKALPFERLTESEKFALIHSEISADITRWLKRIRHLPVAKWRALRAHVKAEFRRSHSFKRTMELIREWEKEVPNPGPAQFRYLVVTEAHKRKEVFPHYHIIIHEVKHSLSEEVLRTQWRSRVGFAEAQLVRGDPLRMLYLCKYLTKDSRARVRASIGYGDPVSRQNPAKPGFDLSPVIQPATLVGSEDGKVLSVERKSPSKEREKSLLETDLKRSEEELENHGLSNNRLSVGTETHRLSKDAVSELFNGWLSLRGSRPSGVKPPDPQHEVWNQDKPEGCTVH